MNMRFYQDLLFEEELLEEKSNVVQENIKVQEEKPLLVQEENRPILDYDYRRDEKNLVIDESSPQAPNLDSSLIDSHIKETMEVRAQVQIDDVIKGSTEVKK